MSMLAERKRKQKWSLNPRGNDWVQDSNKFGQKMLEKMGWQSGKGLGAKEDGITEHVKVSYKNDSKGMGFKESNDQWTEHETNFSALLESLSGEKPNEVKLNSLEKKSQSSRARVHYHKFTRGKDLSRYSEKDLANIFGKKSLKESPKVEETEIKTENNDETKKEDNKFLFNAGSMRDYFKKKLPSFGKSNGYVIGHNGVLKKEDSDSESNQRPSFSFNTVDGEEEVSYAGFGFKTETITDTNGDAEETKSKSTFVSYVNGNYSEESVEKKIKKKRKAEEKEVDNVFSPKKKSRKNKEDSSKNSNNSDKDEGVANPAFNPLQTPVKVQKHILNTIEESEEDVSELENSILKYGTTTVQVHPSPSKKKKYSSESSHNDLETEETSVELKKKHRKSKQPENGVENSVFVENDSIELAFNAEKENDIETSSFEVKRKENKKNKRDKTQNEEVKVKKTKKKGSKNLEQDTDLTTEPKSVYENPNFEETAEQPSPNLQIEENPYEVKPKKSKKNKQENQTTKLASDHSGKSSIEDVSSKPKSKKKKKDTTFALENPSFDDNLEHGVDSTEIEENPYEVKVKKKKKSKTGLDNVNFNESTEESTNLPQTEENPFEVPRKKKEKKKKSEDYAVENPNFNESLEERASPPAEANPYEVKPKKKKKKKDDALAIDNPNFNANDSAESNSSAPRGKENKENVSSTSPDISNVSLDVVESDLMLNVVTTPIIKRTEQANGDNSFSITQVSSVKRRKSVRFSDVTQERIIPNNDDLRNLSDIENRNELFEINTQVINSSLEDRTINFDMSALDKVSYDSRKGGKKKKLGLDNAAFDKQKTNLEENLDSISKTIERYQAEIENDMNEKKLETFTMEDIMIGEVGNPHGEHEKLPNGTKLKFKYANFLSRSPFYHLDKTGAKKAYKHLIKGDIVVGFTNTNLHEIQGYAVRNTVTADNV